MELERIWEAHCTGRRRGSYEELRPDLVYGHEGTLALILPELERLGGPRLKPECLFFVVDHFAPPSTGPFADIVQDFKGFCRTRSIGLALYEGIGHRLMLESPRVTRGMLVLGADSHTTTIGGKGALGIGLGSTDILAVLMTGTAWLQRPAVSEVGVDGTLPPFVDTRDATLHLLGRVGQAGFLGQVVEFVDSTPDGLSLEAASVLTNMTVEMGAVSGLLAQRMAGDESGSRPGT
ncbi:MAG: hypothetical protein FJ109_20165, partial [Deltaproteobacteria bacterium]|nr:hypothetical protein [Deltaproteobacteria bacterium]